MSDLQEGIRSALFGGAQTAELESPRIGSNAGVRALRYAASVLIAVGLFTVSWDKLANVQLGPYNAKLPALLFSVGALCTIPYWNRFVDVWRQRRVRALLVLIILIVAVLVVASLVSQHIVAGLAQVVAVGTGSIAPAVGLIALIQSRGGLLWALRWLIAGGYFATAFGLYQLIAFYTGLPQFIEYTGVSVGGGAGRIAAFNYEPAYFADFVVLVIGAVITRSVVSGRRVLWLEVGYFAVVLVLCNVRALLFLLPVLAVLLLIRWRQNRRIVLRGIAAGVIVLGANLLGGYVIDSIAVATQASASPPTATNDSTPTQPSSPPSSPDPTVAPSVTPPAVEIVPPNVLDPDEQSSNAPRLALYKAVVKVVAQHPFIGVGPGSLREELAKVGYVAPNQGMQVVANNIWLQALVDGGVVLLVLQAALLIRLVVLFFRRAMTRIQPMIAAWLSVVLVSGMLTSFYFDIKVWAVLGLIVAGTAVTTIRQPSAA